MKKFKNLEKISKNKKQLKEYLLDFKEEKSKEIEKKFIDDDFNCGVSVFRIKMKSIISMPKIGKDTIRYWTSRGWNEKESENLRTKRKYNPEKSPMNKKYWISKGLSEKDAEYKIKTFRKNNIEYWLEKGYSTEKAKIKRNEFQIKNNNKFIIKYKTDKEFKNNFDSKRTNSIEYWLKKGYSKDEAKIKISERQKTFSKDICIKKYGEKEGIRLWKDRQKKWQNSLKKSIYNGVDGKGVNIKKRIKEYNIENLINSLSLKNKKLFVELFNNAKNIEEFITLYSKHFNNDDEVTLYKILLPLKKLKILHSFYNTTDKHIMSLIIPKISRIKTKYSYYSWFNNHICRSDGEYIIANFLFKNEIDYIYEKKYENCNYKCDFYLTKYNLYIEYLGLLKKDNNPYKTKLNYLNKNNINYFASNDINKIKNKILNYVNNSNKRYT